MRTSSASGQDDRLAVRRLQRGLLPRIVPRAQLVGQDDALVGDELLERGQPVVIVATAVVGFATRFGGGDWRCLAWAE